MQEAPDFSGEVLVSIVGKQDEPAKCGCFELVKWQINNLEEQSSVYWSKQTRGEQRNARKG